MTYERYQNKESIVSFRPNEFLWKSNKLTGGIPLKYLSRH